MKQMNGKKSTKKFIILTIIIVVVTTVYIFANIYINSKITKEMEKDNDTTKNNEMTYINGKSLKDLPKEIPVEYAVREGYFVYDGTKDENIVYNKNVLDRFIKNTEINAINRVADKIRIVVYNYDGYPTIYDLEYKIFDETYTKERKEIHKTGYILTTDATRNNIIPKDITINDNIPGEIYGITLTEEPGVNAASISLALYALIDYVSPNVKQYQNIEIARYLLDAKIINE